jgi:general secretion pathway protein J
MRGAAEHSLSQAPRQRCVAGDEAVVPTTQPASPAERDSQAPRQRGVAGDEAVVPTTHPARTAQRESQAGFTLLEVVIALAIVGALLAIAFGGLRIAQSAWTRGEERAEVHDHARALAGILVRSIAGAFPYRISASDAPEPLVQFDGTADSLSFVTTTAPLPVDETIAFTAVRLSVDGGDTPGLVIRERALPNRDVFTEAAPVLRDPAVRSLKFRYLTPSGGWEDTWDGATEQTLPAAVQVTVETTLEGRAAALPPITVSLRVTGAKP